MAEFYDVAVIGAGASGLVCAEAAAKRNRRVLVLDHNKGPGRKILMSGGGRCNFTNRRVSADQFISTNPHFCKSALSRYSELDFLDRIQEAGIAFEERELGRLFCRGKASQILDLLLDGCRKARVRFSFQMEDIQVCHDAVAHPNHPFIIDTGKNRVLARSLVVATGGVSIPGAGASPFGYRLAEQFGIQVVSPRPGLVPFTLNPDDKAHLQPLAGIAVKARVGIGRIGFTENLLFTHRGVSGPAILQISSHWQPGQSIAIDLLPDMDLETEFKKQQKAHPKRQIKTIVRDFLPKRLVQARLSKKLGNTPVGPASHKQLFQAA
ncbi:MAG: NAD(P)/FAD-dependent oxidoreductase, partial [Desulfobacterales bacterium]|nr:NAD(P)/FAD-dependent oxidoreductase [Desulfobacterales bacterium]